MYRSNEIRNLEKLICSNEIQTYHSKLIAKRFAVKRGWNKKDVLQIKRVIDRQWIIAKDKGDYIECILWDDIGSLKLKKE